MEVQFEDTGFGFYKHKLHTPSFQIVHGVHYPVFVKGHGGSFLESYKKTKKIYIYDTFVYYHIITICYIHSF